MTFIRNRPILSFLLSLTFLPASVGQGDPGPDTIEVQIDDKVGKVTYHDRKVEETTYAIARRFTVSLDEIMKWNPNLLILGQSTRLLIPVPESNIVYRKPLFAKRAEYIPLVYRVRRKDNVFRISRIYFDMPTKLLLHRNKMSSEDLTIGQVLHVGWLKREIQPLVVLEGKEWPANGGDLSQVFILQGHNLSEKNEVAFWKKSANTKGAFVMHRRAATGSIIEITNPLQGEVIYAKVVGKIPSNLYASEIDMVISGELARSLGAFDQKFFVRSRYQPDQRSASR